MQLQPTSLDQHISNPSTSGLTLDYLQHFTYLFVNNEMGQKDTKVFANHSPWESASVGHECGDIWLLSN